MSTINESAMELFAQDLSKISEEREVSKERAFLIWVCENVLEITDSSDVEEAVSIGGERSYGVDIFHIENNGDEIDQYMCWAQVKFAEELNLEITKKDIESFAETIDALENSPPDANPIFKEKAQDFADMGKTEARIRKRMLLVVAGKLTQQARNLCDDDSWKALKISNLYGPSIEFEVLDLPKILSYIKIPPTPMRRIRFDGNSIMRIDSVTQKRSIMGYVCAEDMVEITKDHRDKIFLENPRESLGETATNKAIRATLEDDTLRKKFWKLNNGITAICDSLTEADYEGNAYNIENFKIVNGRQTTFTLEKSSSSLKDVFLFIAVHEAVDGQERTLISEATNTQNAIKRVDLITNSQELMDLEQHCNRDFPCFYFERQTKGFRAGSTSMRQRVTRRRVLDKNLTARSYYAYEINPNDAMKSEREFFGDSQYYDAVFKNRTIRELIIPHIFMDMIKSLHTKWRADGEHERDGAIISKRNVKYYLLRLIHESLFSIDDSERTKIEDEMIRYFQRLAKNETPEIFYDIASATYYDFMLNFNQLRNETWPEDILSAINDNGSNTSQPSPYDIMYRLKKRGDRILPLLLSNRQYNHNLAGDSIRKKLLTLIEPSGSAEM